MNLNEIVDCIKILKNYKIGNTINNDYYITVEKNSIILYFNHSPVLSFHFDSDKGRFSYSKSIHIVDVSDTTIFIYLFGKELFMVNGNSYNMRSDDEKFQTELIEPYFQYYNELCDLVDSDIYQIVIKTTEDDISVLKHYLDTCK